MNIDVNKISNFNFSHENTVHNVSMLFYTMHVAGAYVFLHGFFKVNIILKKDYLQQFYNIAKAIM